MTKNISQLEKEIMEEYFEKYGGLITHPLANGLKSFLSASLAKVRRETVRIGVGHERQAQDVAKNHQHLYKDKEEAFLEGFRYARNNLQKSKTELLNKIKE